MTYILIALAVLPALAILLYIHHIDKAEKEPWKLLLSIVLFGALSVIPILICEGIIMKIVNTLFAENSLPAAIAEAFICAALTEESFKLLVLRKKTWNSSEFNYIFDGTVYAVAASMGFAVVENIFYVLENGIATGILRALTAVPGHMLFGVFMGMYYGLAKREDLLGNSAGRRKYMFLAWLLPLMLHGFYDFCLMVHNMLLLLAGFVYYVTLLISAFRMLSRISKEDAPLPVAGAPVYPPIPPAGGMMPQNPAYPTAGGMMPQNPAYPTAGGMMPQNPAYPTAGGMMPQNPAYPTAEGMMPQNPAYPTAGGMMPQNPAYPTAGGMMPQNPAYPTAGGMMPQNPAYPTAGDIMPQNPVYPPVNGADDPFLPPQ